MSKKRYDEDDEIEDYEDNEDDESIIDDWLDMAYSVENDTVYSRFGMLTHDDRYKGETGDIVNKIKNDNNLSNDQAYYFLYFMLQSGLTYEETKEQLLSSKDFEMYDKNKKLKRGEI